MQHAALVQGCQIETRQALGRWSVSVEAPLKLARADKAQAMTGLEELPPAWRQLAVEIQQGGLAEALHG